MSKLAKIVLLCVVASLMFCGCKNDAQTEGGDISTAEKKQKATVEK